MQRKKLIATAVIGRASILVEGITSVLSRHNFIIKLKYESVDVASASKLARSGCSLCLITEDKFIDAELEPFVRSLRCACSNCCIVVLSKDCSTDDLEALLVSGANGWLPLTIGPEAFVNAINLIVSNQLNVAVIRSANVNVENLELVSRQTPAPTAINPELAPMSPSVEQFRRLASLSEREKSVLECLLKGESNKHIARALLISEATVKIHVRTLLKKIGAENRTQAAVWALQGHHQSIKGNELNGSLKN